MNFARGFVIYIFEKQFLIVFLSPVYTTLNFWYGTDKIDTRTTFLVLGLPIYVVQEPKNWTVPKIERSVNEALMLYLAPGVIVRKISFWTAIFHFYF